MTTTTLLGYEVGTGRLVPTLAALLGAIAVVAGVQAVSRRRRARPGARGRAAAAVVTGLAGGLLGGVHAAQAAGGVGTGNGLAAAVVAVALGAAAILLGGVTLVRSRAAAAPRSVAPADRVRR